MIAPVSSLIWFPSRRSTKMMVRIGHCEKNLNRRLSRQTTSMGNATLACQADGTNPSASFAFSTLVRMLCPNFPIRRQIVRRSDCKKGFQAVGSTEPGKRVPASYTWSKLLARVFKIDITACYCGGRLRVIAAVQDVISAGRYLRHVGTKDQLPARAPPRYEQPALNFDHPGTSVPTSEVEF
jgi:hypothetical protein